MTAPTVERKTVGWTADASTFGARLALIRQRMGWGNVDKAAKACGLPVETWRSWERDNREPHRMTRIAKQIAGATGCDYLWLVHGPDRGEGGDDLGPNKRLDPLAARVIPRRSRPRSQPNRPGHSGRPAAPVNPTRRRPVEVHPASRAERTAA